MSSSPPPPAVALSSGSRSFNLVWAALAHALAYRRLGKGKGASMKIVNQARAGDDPVIVYGTMQVLREMDVRHPAALVLQEFLEGHHSRFGCGCTTLLAWVGLFASALEQLQRSTNLQASVVANTLAEIRDRCIALTEPHNSSSSAKQEAKSCVLPLMRLLDEYLASRPGSSVASSGDAAVHPVAIVAPSKPATSGGDDESSWFFAEEDGEDSTPSIDSLLSTLSKALPLPGAATPTIAAFANDSDALARFLACLGAGLSHGQDDAMCAAVQIVLRLLRADGVRTAAELRDRLSQAKKGETDLTESCDLASMVTLQASIGSSSAIAASTSHPAAHESPSRCWRLVDGLVLDLVPTDVSRIRSILLRSSSSAASQGSTAQRASAEEPVLVPMGIVLVLGDVAGPEDDSIVSLGTAASPSEVQASLQRAENRRDAFLSKLLNLLRLLKVSLVLSKGSFSRDILSHLGAQGIIVLEMMNLPALEGVSRLARAPVVAELSEIGPAHVGWIRASVIDVGWNTEQAHQHVVREMEKGSEGQTSVSKLVLSPCSDPSSSSSSVVKDSVISPGSLQLTVFSAHSTPLHSRIFTASFWNCLSRLRLALRDGSVLRGGGQLQKRWIRSLEGEAERRERDLGAKLKESPSATLDTELSVTSQEIALHRTVAEAFRHFLQLLADNEAEGSDEERWVRAHGYNELSAAVPSVAGVASTQSRPLYDCIGSTTAALSTCIYLFQLFAHVDATLLCANGRTLYQSMHARETRVLFFPRAAALSPAMAAGSEQLAAVTLLQKHTPPAASSPSTPAAVSALAAYVMRAMPQPRIESHRPTATHGDTHENQMVRMELLQRALAHWGMELTVLTADHTKLKQAYSDALNQLRTRNEEFATLRTSHTQLQNVHRTAQKQLTSVGTELTAAGARIDSLEITVASSDAFARGQILAAQSATQRYDLLQQHSNETYARLKTTRAALTSTRSALAQSRAEAFALKISNATISAEHAQFAAEQLKPQLTLVEAELSHRAEVEQLQAELDAARAEIAILIATPLVDAERLVAAKRERLDAQADALGAQELAEKSRQQAAHACAQAAAVQDRVVAVKQEMTDARADVLGAKQQADRNKRRADETAEQLSAESKRHQATSAERERVAAELAEASTRAVALSQQLAAISEQTECTICFDRLRSAACVPCGHRACWQCLQRICAPGAAAAGPPCCPECRQPIAKVRPDN